ncbi:hypothetical protein [Pseudomonas sp. EMN2]|uniref:hypothetical protein n=1 Tax=Pseudomonas sp. EMN2 TaxID=2615212 RepID=UPI00129B09C3|nr:hypothetical protein [Pseudomonas sp. EMN2]
MTANKVGRPEIFGAESTLKASYRFREDLYEILSRGAELQARYLGALHPKKRELKPSHSAWIRALVDYAYDNRGQHCIETEILPGMAAAVIEDESMTRVSVKIPNQTRVRLRKYECEMQAHDWDMDFDRNASIALMVTLDGEALNKSFV